jgi:hypothetical protein
LFSFPPKLTPCPALSILERRNYKAGNELSPLVFAGSPAFAKQKVGCLERRPGDEFRKSGNFILKHVFHKTFKTVLIYHIMTIQDNS